MPDSIIAIIPARWESTRFPGKPLADIAGKPMIQWVYERTCRAETLDKTIVATDDQRIFDSVQSFGGQVVLTPKKISTGTERVAFVAKDLKADIIINVQGDEPLIEPASVDLVAKVLQSDEIAVMATLARKVTVSDELKDVNNVRVVLDKNNRALYFSRSIIPYYRDKDINEWIFYHTYYAHIGIYAFRRNFLLQFEHLSSLLEKAEKLEQLRAIENGYTIKVGICDAKPICVDVPEHLELVNRRIKELNIL